MGDLTALDLRFEIKQSDGPQTVTLGIYHILPTDSFSFRLAEAGDDNGIFPNATMANDSNYRLFELGALSPSNYKFQGMLFSDNDKAVQWKFELNCTNTSASACLSDICC